MPARFQNFEEAASAFVSQVSPSLIGFMAIEEFTPGDVVKFLAALEPRMKAALIDDTLRHAEAAIALNPRARMFPGYVEATEGPPSTDAGSAVDSAS